MHNGPTTFVDSYATLTISFEQHMAPGSDGLVDVYNLYERVNGREGVQKDQNLPNLPDIELS